MKRTLLSSLPISTILSAFLVICQFYALAQPTITSFSPSAGDVGTSVTVTGTNFNLTPSSNIVMFGATKATVAAASAAQLTVTVPSGATYSAIQVLNSATGLLTYSASNFTPTFSPNKESITNTDFNPKIDYTTGQGPCSVAIGDLDGDGKADVVVANIGSNTVSVFRNMGTSGTVIYAAKVDLTTGSNPRAVSLADLNGDGKVEIVTSNSIGTVSVFRNTSTSGTVSFTTKVDFSGGSSSLSIAIGDLDGDGRADMALANYFNSAVSVLRNTSSSGSISFDAKLDFTTGFYPNSVAIGDLDGDGKPDLAVTNNNYNNTLSVLQNTSISSNISFASKIDFTTTNNPLSVAIGDLDGDSKADLAVANNSSNTVSIFHNIGSSGSVSFSPRVDFGTGSFPFNVSIGDLDGDGRVELVTANSGSNTVSIFRNTSNSGNISYSAKLDFATGTIPYAVAIGDLDGDGKPELAIANSNSNSVSIIRNNIKANQTITFNTLPLKTYGNSPFDLTATATSNLPITYSSSDLSVATISGSTVTVLKAGTATITASQAGNNNYNPAVDVSQSLTVNKADQTITFPALPNKNSGDAPFDLAGTSSSGLILTYTSSNNAVATVSGNRVTIVGAGTTVLTAKQAGNADYKPAVDVSQSLTIASPPPAITSFSPISGQAGTLVAITGTNFNLTPSNNIVMFGATKATITAASATQLTVTVPSAATYAPITVLNSTTGLLAYSATRFTPTFSPSKSSIGAADFATLADYRLESTNPNVVTQGDLDGDGKIDLIVSYAGNNSISVLRNTSSGANNFSYVESIFNADGNTSFISVADINGDGKLDLVVLNGNSVSILRNTSAGVDNIAFAPRVEFATDMVNAWAVAIGDLDGDGKADLAITNTEGAKVSILRNTSTGAGNISYAPKVEFATVVGPISISIGDLDGDGKADIAVAGSNGTLSLLRNTSTGLGNIRYAAGVEYSGALGFEPMSMSLGDLDNDGKDDLAIVSRGSDRMTILRNKSSGPGNIRYENGLAFSTGPYPTSVSMGDLDGDEKVDLVVTNANLSTPQTKIFTVSVFKNTSLESGSITYAPKIDYATGEYPWSASIADLDGDGKPDLAVGNLGTNTVSIIRNNPVFNNQPTIANFSPKSGSIGTSVVITGTNFNTTLANNVVMFGATAATVTAATSTSLTVTVPSGATYSPISVLNTATGLLAYSNSNFTPTFSPNKSSISTADFSPKIDFSAGSPLYSFAIGDLDNDGKSDLALADLYAVMLMGNTSTGIGNIGLTVNPTAFEAGRGAISASVGDFDGDGKLDLAIPNNEDYSISIGRNTSNGSSGISFAPKVDFFSGGSNTSFSPSFVVVGDLDTDGKADLVVANQFTISLLRNISAGPGNIGFSNRSNDITIGPSSFSLAIGDLDGDGKPDLAVAIQNSNTVSVFRNTSNEIGVISFSNEPESYDTGTDPKALSIGDLDGDGKADLAVINEGSATISVFRNTSVGTGSISYSSKVDFATNPSPAFVSIGDLNGDNKLELIVTNDNDNSISVFSNTSSGIGNIGFAPRVNYATDANPQSVTIGDLDGDGKPELAVPNLETGVISIFRNNVKVGQTITFTALANKTFGDTPFTLSGTSSSGLALTYTSSNTTVATVSGNTVTIVGAGSTTITASQSGNNSNNPALDVSQSLTVNKASQTITFTALPSKTFGDAPFTLSGTSSSGLAVTYISSNTAVATVSGNTVTIVGAGTATLTAKQAGNSNYNPSVDVTQSLTVNKASQTITFTSLANKTFGDAPFTLSGTSSSGLSVTYTSNNTAVATVSGNTVTIVGAGTTSITTSQAGNNNYNPAVDVAQSLTVGKASQTITFAALSSKTFGDAPFTLSGTSSSGLSLTYTSNNTAVATVSGNTVSIVGVGAATITAKQAGNANYNSAVDVAQPLSVNKANQTITFTTLSSKTFGDAPFTLSATSSSGLAPTYTSSNTAVATVSGNTVTIVGAGTTSITASQAGNSNYNAGETSQQLTVNKALQTITFTTLSNKTFGDAPFTLSGTSSSGLPLTFASGNTAVATVSGNTVTIVGGGTTTITASQAGNNNYNPAETPQSFTVNKSSQTITFAALVSKAFGDAPLSLSGSSSSGLTLNYSSSNTGVATVSGTTVTIVGAGTAMITAKQAGNNNYNPAVDVSRQLTVNKASQNITFAPLESKTFGDVPFTLSASASSALLITYASSDPSVVAIEGNTVTILRAGTTTITASQAGNNNYLATADKQQVLTINKAQPSLSWPTPADIDFGTSLNSTQLNATSSVSGSFTYVPTAGTKLNIGSGQQLSVTFTPTDVVNYNSATKQVFINVNKIAPTITWSSPADIVYGTVLGATQLNATASVNGTFSYTPATGTKLSAGVNQLSVTFTPTDAVNYSAATKVVTINVSKATPTVNWSNPADIVYGTSLSSTQLNATSLEGGTFTYNPSIGEKLNAGSGQSLSVSFTPSDAVNFTSVTKQVMLNVAKATPAITWSTPADLVYGTPLSSTQLSATAEVAGTFSYAPAIGVTLNAGNGQQLLVTFVPTDAANYLSTTASVSINVTRAQLQISFATIADKTLGNEPFILTASSNSTLPVIFSSNSDKVSIINNQVTLLKAGRVSITASQVGNENYNVASSVTQSFCIKPAKPTVTMSNLNTPTPLLTSNASAGNQWYADGTAIAGATSATFSATKSGNYKVQVTVDDCTGEFSAEQPLVITGIEAKDFPIELYPNPVSDVLTIYFGDLAGNKQLTIFALAGQELISTKTESGSISINVSDLSAGMYLAKVIAGGTVQTKKFNKQ